MNDAKVDFDKMDKCIRSNFQFIVTSMVVII